MLPILLFALIFLSPPALSQLSSDTRALLEFKKGIQYDPSGLTASWTSAAGAACPSTWYGVTCGGGGLAVVGLSLSGLNLSGEVKFATLTPMSSLQTLTLSGNNLTGRLVPVIGSIQSLQHLDLSGNQFYGPIPPRIADLYSLAHLNLSSNRFSGGFPSEIRNLQQLRVLDISSNSLWGDVKAIFSELHNVEYVDLSGNRFYGEFLLDDEKLSSLANTLKYMNLSGNQITGGFGKGVGLFRNLEVLDLGQNRLSGELPQFDSMTNLKVLRVANNLLYGIIPEGLFESGMHLEELDLSGNGFTGYAHTINSTTLKVLNLSSNYLSGRLPSSIGICRAVDLSKNQLSGDLTAIQSWGDTLEIIDLSSNSLSGNYPNVTSQFGNVISIKLKNNSVTGNLPSVLGRYPRLSKLDFSLNKLSGPILPSLFTSLTLTMLNLSGNQLTGQIQIRGSHSTESLVLPSSPHIEILDLSDNLLYGSLPPEIGNLQNLKLLNLGNNSLSGELPDEITKLSGLNVVDLSMNKITGRILDMPQSGLEVYNVSYNDLSGTIPESLTNFPETSFYPGNPLLVLPDSMSRGRNKNNTTVIANVSKHKPSNSNVRVAYILGSMGAILLVFFVSMAVYKMKSQEIWGRNRYKDHIARRDVKFGFGQSTMFKSAKNESLQSSLSFTNDHLLTSASRSMSAQKELLTEIVEYGFADAKDGTPEHAELDLLQRGAPGRKSSPESPLSLPCIDSRILDRSVTLDVNSPDRLAGELFILDTFLVFTAEQLSRAPAEVLGRSSHGTSYKATLDNGYVLTVKWLRIGLVKHKKEFSKEARRIGTINHPNIIPWRGYYWGPREQERLIVSDYVNGESLALYLHESTPRRYSRLSVTQRLKIAVDIARSLFHLHHDKALPHGNLKPTNILLTGPDLTAQLTDYGLHRLLNPTGISEQILNLGALGYRAPELAESVKPLPSFKADVYAFGVIMMELLTRKSAGDIILGQSGTVELTDWVQMFSREERGAECFDREIAGLVEAPSVMDRLLTVSLKCILPVNERPNIRTVFDDLCSITM